MTDWLINVHIASRLLKIILVNAVGRLIYRQDKDDIHSIMNSSISPFVMSTICYLFIYLSETVQNPKKIILQSQEKKQHCKHELFCAVCFKRLYDIYSLVKYSKATLQILSNAPGHLLNVSCASF